MSWKVTAFLSLTLVFCYVGEVVRGSTTSSPANATSTTPGTTTTLAPDKYCQSLSNGTCESCVADGDRNCYYCETNKQCGYYDTVIPIHENCKDLGDVKWRTCKINFKVVIICVSTAAGILLLGITICCCCCCRKHNKSIWKRDQAKWDQQREDIKMRTDERKKERQSRTDQIRRKYGLMKDDNAYHRFDA